MTSALASIGVSYDGVDLQQSDLSVFLEIKVGLDDGAEVRGQDTVVPYRDGRVSRPRRFDRRRIVLEGFVQGDGDTRDLAMSAYRSSRRGLAQLFDPARNEATLRLILEDGDITRCEARPLSIEVNEVVQSQFAYVSVELEAVSEWEGLGS